MFLELDARFLEKFYRVLSIHIHPRSARDQFDEDSLQRPRRTWDWSWSWIDRNKHPADFSPHYPWMSDLTEWSSESPHWVLNIGIDIPRSFWIHPTVARQCREIQCPKRGKRRFDSLQPDRFRTMATKGYLRMSFRMERNSSSTLCAQTSLIV